VSQTGPPPSPPNWGPPGGPFPPLPDAPDGPDPYGGYDTEPVLSWQDPDADQPLPTTPHNPYLTPEDTFPTTSPYAQPVDPVAYAAEHEAARDEVQAGAGAAAPDGGGGGGRSGGGAHRVRRSPMRYVLPAILGALVLVLIGIGMAGWLGSKPSDQGTTGSSQVHVSSPASTPPTASASSPSATATSASPSPSTSPSPSASASPKPRPTATAPVPPPVVHAPTVVLNETTETGLAARVAQHLRSLGWTVTGVGNWRGNISSSTVYYPVGMRAAAQRLAYDLGVSRLRPVVPGMLGDRLTVVLTSDPLN